MIEVVGAHRVGMQLKAREVGHPDEGRGISWDDLLGGPAGRKLQRDDLYPVGSRLRCPLLVEELPINSIRIPYEHIRPVSCRAQRSRGDRDVVLRNIELRIAGLREKYLARVRDRHVATIDSQHFMFDSARHASIVAWDPDSAPILLRRIGLSHASGVPAAVLRVMCVEEEQTDVRRRHESREHDHQWG